MLWDPETDNVSFDIPTPIQQRITRRSVLETVMKIYDPMGLLSPFMVSSRILLRETWELKLAWDQELPVELVRRWHVFYLNMRDLKNVNYDRCLKPLNTVGKPILILLSDASEKAYGYAAYIRWERSDGSVWCRLIMAKTRIALMRRLSIPQLELNAAVLSKRGRAVIQKETRFEYDQIYQLVDSATVLCMLNKISTRFRLYEGVRIGEIQAATEGNMTDWH